MNIKIFNEGKQIVGLYKTKPLFFSKEFLNYAEEIWQLEFPDRNILLIEHENGMSVYKFEENCKIDIIDSNLFKCPHKITPDIPMFLRKTLKPKKPKEDTVVDWGSVPHAYQINTSSDWLPYPETHHQIIMDDITDGQDPNATF